MDKIMWRFFRAALTPLLLLPLLPGCACGVSNLPQGDSLRTYNSFGSVQCSGGGITLEEMQRQLKEGGIRVLSARCGIDGKMHVAMCGAPDGRIAIVEIPASQAQAAATLGFLPLKNLPDASEVPCGTD